MLPTLRVKLQLRGLSNIPLLQVYCRTDRESATVWSKLQVHPKSMLLYSIQTKKCQWVIIWISMLMWCLCDGVTIKTLLNSKLTIKLAVSAMAIPHYRLSRVSWTKKTENVAVHLWHLMIMKLIQTHMIIWLCLLLIFECTGTFSKNKTWHYISLS